MSVSLILLSAAGLAVLAVLVWGSASIRSGLYLHALCRGGRTGRSVALTFDDGPDPLHTPRVLDVLARHGVRATFFLVGEKAAACPELVRRIVAEGHTVGNHSHTHDSLFPLRRERRMVEELCTAGEVVRSIVGRRPRHDPHDRPGRRPPAADSRRLERPLAGYGGPSAARAGTGAHRAATAPRSGDPAARPLSAKRPAHGAAARNARPTRVPHKYRRTHVRHRSL